VSIEMQLRLERTDFNLSCTVGRLFVDGDFECYTLEDCVREGPKIHGHTAIPAGNYQVIVTHSPRFHRRLPLLVDVPGFVGIRIHPGNTDADTEGCLLVGESVAVGGEALLRSRAAFDPLLEKIEAAIEGGEDVWISVIAWEPALAAH